MTRGLCKYLRMNLKNTYKICSDFHPGMGKDHSHIIQVKIMVGNEIKLCFVAYYEVSLTQLLWNEWSMGREGKMWRKKKGNHVHVCFFLVMCGFQLRTRGLTCPKFQTTALRSIPYSALCSMAVTSGIELTPPYTLILFLLFWIYSHLQ